MSYRGSLKMRRMSTASVLTTVRAYLIRCKRRSGPGNAGLIGNNSALTSGASFSPSSRRAAWIDWPPTMSRDGAM
jgi:hypothetical protein